MLEGSFLLNYEGHHFNICSSLNHKGFTFKTYGLQRVMVGGAYIDIFTEL